MTPQQWIKAIEAIGIISKSRRYGGTYAHTDIASEFAHGYYLERIINAIILASVKAHFE